MCRTRRIKVRKFSMEPMVEGYVLTVSLLSATKLNQLVYNARNQGAPVQDTKTTSTSSSAMRLKLQRGEHGARSPAKRSIIRLLS
jgi:hypothetical protein